MKHSIVKEPVSLYTADDGLYTPEIGSWGVQKYNLVALYDELFSTGMKKKWNRRVYIDLFACAGKARLKDGGKVVLASPLLALGVPDPFDRYIFCENDRKAMNALQTRIRKHYSDRDVHFVEGDCNELVDQIIAKIPRYSKDLKVLSFCFVDPFSLILNPAPRGWRSEKKG